MDNALQGAINKQVKIVIKLVMECASETMMVTKSMNSVCGKTDSRNMKSFQFINWTGGTV